MSDLEKKIEALLFVAGEPMSPEKLSKLLKKDKEEIKKALGTLGDNLLERGIRVSRNNNEYILITAPELSGATLETLAVIVYKGSLSRAKIDYIRGVNSSFTVRNLMIRGLVERKPDPDDSRSWLYSPSFDFLKYMGIERIENLAGYEDFKKEMDELLKREIKEEE